MKANRLPAPALAAAALLAAMALLAAVTGCTDRFAGGGSETEYFTLSGEAALPSGAPAAGARVNVRPADYLSGEVPSDDGTVRDTVLDASGSFILAGLPPGKYLVEIRLGDSLGVLQAVSRGPSPTVRIAAALAPMGRLRAAVARPDSGVAYILRVRGMERIAVADASGNITVTLPGGEFQALLSASRAGSQVLAWSRIAIRSSADTVLAPLPSAALLPKPPAPVIYDCNIGFAADDAGGLAVLHALADRGEARILAVGTSEPSRLSPAVLDAINTYYHRGDLPVGAWKRKIPSSRSGYDSLIAADFPQDLADWDALPEASEVYRAALASQPDGRAVLVVSGGVHNAWALLRLDRDLVARKVKELVVMGGQYPSGKEYNFTIDISLDSVANLPAELVRDWPTPITFHGHEVSFTIRTGACLGGSPAANPVRRIYEIAEGGAGKASVSSDLTPVLYGVRGTGSLFDRVTVGSNIIAADGSNQWVAAPDSDQSYLVLSAPADNLAADLDALLCSDPPP